MTRFFPFCFLVTFFVSSIDLKAQSNEAQAIAKASKAFSQAYVDGDLEAQMKFYTNDVVIIPGNRLMITGIEGVTRYWKTPESVKILSHKATTTKLEISGNMASDYGVYEGTSERNGVKSSFKGQYVIVWKKGKDGQWRMAVDMWSSLRNN